MEEKLHNSNVDKDSWGKKGPNEEFRKPMYKKTKNLYF